MNSLTEFFDFPPEADGFDWEITFTLLGLSMIGCALMALFMVALLLLQRFNIIS